MRASGSLRPGYFFPWTQTKKRPPAAVLNQAMETSIDTLQS